VDYIHVNPLKHGYVSCVKDWRWSSFHRFVEAGDYTENWGAGIEIAQNPAMFGDEEFA
jgi:putative transposase